MGSSPFRTSAFSDQESSSYCKLFTSVNIRLLFEQISLYSPVCLHNKLFTDLFLKHNTCVAMFKFHYFYCRRELRVPLFALSSWGGHGKDLW